MTPVEWPHENNPYPGDRQLFFLPPGRPRCKEKSYAGQQKAKGRIACWLLKVLKLNKINNLPMINKVNILAGVMQLLTVHKLLRWQRFFPL
jgi:hypothetical protein